LSKKTGKTNKLVKANSNVSVKTEQQKKLA
jgi:hypothetical protein